MSNEVLLDIETRIKELESRMESGAIIIGQCKRQMRVLKNKLKEYKRLKQTVITKYIDGADGDL